LPLHTGGATPWRKVAKVKELDLGPCINPVHTWIDQGIIWGALMVGNHWRCMYCYKDYFDNHIRLPLSERTQNDKWVWRGEKRPINDKRVKD
jgi:hypothetical protein